MQKISKSSSFFRRYYFYFMGAFWILGGFFMLISQVKNWVGWGYAGIGIIYFIIGYIKKDKSEEYIAWNSDKIKIGQLYNEALVYTRSQIDSISLSRNNLTIKSGAAAGIMVELKGYKSQDLQKLKEELNFYYNKLQ